jgi:hypothetical protein
MSGFEDRYEITRSGHLWSIRLGRFIKHQFDPLTNRRYISVVISGKRQTRNIWRAVADSWLSPYDRQAILGRVPPEALGQLTLLKTMKAEIASIAREYDIPQQVVFSTLLTNENVGAA